jgi:hypothetical protein
VISKHTYLKKNDQRLSNFRTESIEAKFSLHLTIFSVYFSSLAQKNEIAPTQKIFSEGRGGATIPSQNKKKESLNNL